MLWPPTYSLVISLPVAMLDPRRTTNRIQRRKAHYGRATLAERMNGRLTPKQMREAGL